MSRIRQSAIVAILFMVGVLPLGATPPSAAPPEGVSTPPVSSLEIDPARSLLVHQPELLSGLTLGAVMERLAASAGSTDGKVVFRQWWSTLGEGSDELVEAGLACPANGSRVQLPTLNFPMLCDPYLAWIGEMADPFGESGRAPFLVIAAVNRVDLMPRGPHPHECGEYRLVVAYDPQWLGWPEYRPNERVEAFINFEAAIPNPGGDPRFCLAIQRFWASLTAEVDPAAVAEGLQRFYLEGGRLTADGRLLRGDGNGEWTFALPPAISAANLGGDAAHRRGQVRINTRTAHGWVLREFEFRDLNGAMRLVPVPAQGSPDASLFKENTEGAEVLAEVIRAQPRLLSASIDSFNFTPEFAGVEASQWIIPLHGMPESQFSYSDILGNEPWANDPLRNSIKVLAAASPAMRTPSIVKRLEVVSCAGCHRYVRGARAGFVDETGRPVKWPPSIRFTHMLPELDGGGAYLISDALACVLLPQRERRLRQVLGGAADPTPEDPAASDRCRLYFE